jgi:hypothetical protein
MVSAADGPPSQRESRHQPGSVITLTVDPATREILDCGIGDRQPDLAALGTVHSLPVGKVGAG